MASCAAHWSELHDLLLRFQLKLTKVTAGAAIPGSYWGDSEAGLIEGRLYARADTPVHSALHEACHYICMDQQRRAQLHTDAGGTDLEECAVCYLQILLADELPGVGRERLMADMDAWGYSFRLGTTREWFDNDAADARQWLLDHALISHSGQPRFRLRSALRLV
ncbi:MAG: hypothetical protein Tsb002_27510 [Wenzhouxiangellaceae bacterium]